MSDLNGGIQLADKLEKMIPQYNMDNISSLTVVKNAYNENVMTPSQVVATIRNNLSHGVREHYEDGFSILVNYLEGAVRYHLFEFFTEDKEVADSASHFTGFRPADRLSDCL